MIATKHISTIIYFNHRLGYNIKLTDPVCKGLPLTVVYNELCTMYTWVWGEEILLKNPPFEDCLVLELTLAELEVIAD